MALASRDVVVFVVVVQEVPPNGRDSLRSDIERGCVERVAADAKVARSVEVDDGPREFLESILVCDETTKLRQLTDVIGQGGEVTTGDHERTEVGAVLGHGPY